MAQQDRLGKYFYIRSQKNCSLVLEVKDAADAPCAAVVAAEPRTEAQGNDHQLWFCDPVSGTVRTKLNHFCMDLQNDLLVVNPFLQGNGNQLWVRQEDKLQCQEDFELVLGLPEEEPDAPGVHVTAAMDQDLAGQSWTFEHRPAFYFIIRTQEHAKVLDVRGGDPKPGAKVIVYSDKGDMADNQLWYEDENGVIRSKLNSYALDMSGKNPVLFPYSEGNQREQWVVGGSTIQNSLNRAEVIEIKEGGVFSSTSLVAAEFTGSIQQTWFFDFIADQALSLNHSGTGKHFIIRSRLSGLVLEVQDGVAAPEVPLVTSYRCTDPAINDQQLFYCDEPTGTIRTALNDYCIDLEGDVMVINPYDPYEKNQQWRHFAKKIQNRHKLEKVLELVDGVLSAGAKVSTADFAGEDKQLWDITHVPAKCFNIASLVHGKVMTVDKGDASAGAKVVISELKQGELPQQLWYEDERGIVRSKLNGYVLDCTEDKVKLRPYDPTCQNHQWLKVGDRIQNKIQTNYVLDIAGATQRSGATLVAYKFHGADNQRWQFQYV